MAYVLKRTLEGYRYAIIDLADKRLEHLPLTVSPIPIISLLVAYLMFVLKWGPEFMQNREPFKLNKILVVYNAFQMFVSFILLVLGAYCLEFRLWYCSPITPVHLESPISKYIGYTYYILKIVDLLDTVFFVLRKNYRQVTVLHTFHHTIMVIASWSFVKYVPSGHSCFVPYINTIVHFVMYGYYLLTAYDPKFKSSIWWKKHITQLQLFQFGMIVIIHLVPILNGCDAYPRVFLYFVLINNTIMIILFSNFYYQTYIRKKCKSA